MRPGIGVAAAALWLFAGAAWAKVTPAEIDSLWARRDDPQVARELEPKIRDGLRESPNDFELLWRAARERAWAADNASDPRMKKQAGKEAWNYGERAKELRPERAEGYYYAGVGIGAHAVGVGIFKAISDGLEKKFLENVKKAAEIDPSVDHGGPLLALGRYYFIIPWPKQDLSKSEHYYQEVLEKFPENLRARHYLAQLKLKKNEKAEARVLVEQVQKASVDYDPAEGKRVQSWAQRDAQQTK